MQERRWGAPAAVTDANTRWELGFAGEGNGVGGQAAPSRSPPPPRAPGYRLPSSARANQCSQERCAATACSTCAAGWRRDSAVATAPRCRISSLPTGPSVLWRSEEPSHLQQQLVAGARSAVGRCGRCGPGTGRSPHSVCWCRRLPLPPRQSTPRSAEARPRAGRLTSASGAPPLPPPPARAAWAAWWSWGARIPWSGHRCCGRQCMGGRTGGSWGANAGSGVRAHRGERVDAAAGGARWAAAQARRRMQPRVGHVRGQGTAPCLQAQARTRGSTARHAAQPSR